MAIRSEGGYRCLHRARAGLQSPSSRRKMLVTRRATSWAFSRPATRALNRSTSTKYAKSSVTYVVAKGSRTKRLPRRDNARLLPRASRAPRPATGNAPEGVGQSDVVVLRVHLHERPCVPSRDLEQRSVRPLDHLVEARRTHLLQHLPAQDPSAQASASDKVRLHQQAMLCATNIVRRAACVRRLAQRLRTTSGLLGARCCLGPWAPCPSSPSSGRGSPARG